MIQVLHGFQIPSSRRLRVRPHACMTTDHICNDLFPSLAQFFFSETTSTKINLVTTDFVHTRVYAYATLFYIEKATAYMLPGKLLHHLRRCIDFHRYTSAFTCADVSISTVILVPFCFITHLCLILVQDRGMFTASFSSLFG